MTKRETVQLGDVCEIVSGSTPKTNIKEYWGGDIKWITPAEVSENDCFINDTERHLTQAGIESTALRMMPSGTVLLSSRAPIGKVAITNAEMACNQGFKNLICGERIHNLYLFHYLKKNKRFLESLGRGATFKEITKGIVAGIEIPLPPLSEQRRLASILDEADAVRKARRESLRLLDELVKSTFLDMFGDPNNNHYDFPLGTIRDLAAEVKYGTSKKAGDAGEWPILRMNNITYDGNWDFSDMKYIDLDETDVPKHTVSPGDILFNRTNSKDLVGKTAMFPAGCEPMAFAGYLVRLRTNENALPEYISGFLNSSYGKSVLRHMCKSIIGMANINAQELQDIKILLPPVSLQKKFATFVAEVDRQREAANAAMSESEQLFASLSQRAFRGEL